MQDLAKAKCGALRCNLKKRKEITTCSVIKRLDKNPQVLWRYEPGSLWTKLLMKSVKWNKRAIIKSGPPHVESVGSGKSLHPLNKRMLPFLGSATPRA